MPELDIVIPVYNEGPGFVRVLDALRQSVHLNFRLLICYDREEDTTLAPVREYPHKLDIQFIKNRGSGAHGAVLTGFAESSAPAVLVYPGDDDYNAGIVESLYRRFEEGFDIVAASRFIPGGCMKGCPWLKALLVRVSSFTLYHFAGLTIRDASNGFRLFSRRVLEQIPIESTRGFSYSLELLVKAHRLGWNISEVPAQWFERQHGSSRFRVLRWLPDYLRWYFYAFQTTYLHRGPESVLLKPVCD